MKKLLIIDDEKELLSTLKNFFELSGYLVMTAQNTIVAKQKLGHKPDLILLDVAMPEIDGISFCKEIRDTVSCPIIFLSAQTNENSRLEGLMASLIYYFACMFGGRRYLGQFYLFNLAHFDWQSRLLLFTVGSVLICLSVLYANYCKN